MSGSGQSVLRQAVEGLLRARADAERGLDEVAARVATAAVRPAETARAGRHPLARRAASDAAVVGALLPDDLAAVATVLGDLSRGRAVSKADAAAHPGALQVDVDAARSLSVAAVAPEHRDLVREWLSHPDCHAVEIHGPQVSDRDLELRAGWTRPPDHGTEGADTWRVRPEDQKVVSKHSAGTEATRFNSPEAFARPLDVLLAAATQHPGGVDKIFADHSFGGRVAIFIPADRAGLAEGDAFGYRGAGIGTAEAATDWVKMRGMAMKKDGECLPPVRTLPYDPTSHGPDAGVRLVFARGDDGWTMITYYAAGSPGHDNKRLEDIT